MVLPYDEDPKNFRWPRHKYGALIRECAQYDDDRLTAMARALLKAGSPFVVALREALLRSYDACVYFYPEVLDVAA